MWFSILEQSHFAGLAILMTLISFLKVIFLILLHSFDCINVELLF